MTDGPPGIMHFPQVERTSCSGFPYSKPYFQEKSPFHRGGKQCDCKWYPEFEFPVKVSGNKNYESG